MFTPSGFEAPEGELVYVPLFGDCNDGEPDPNAPQVKAWGLLTDQCNFVPLYTEPKLQAVELFQPIVLFESEERSVKRIENRDTLPDGLCGTLAQLALAPETLVREG